ncbi:MAG: response regulator [Chitinispirillaceae bacterium]|nr:response regulator [Chitinispirillaceae bacterium]
MPDGGTIEVKAKNVSLGGKGHITLSAGNYVKVSVTDHGIGMPKEILHRIFDPFFTTKAQGHGLGLSACYSIVNRHGGCIEVASKPGKGSTFHFYLPALAEATRTVPDMAASQHRGSGTIIIMDDEEVLRDTVGKMLKSFGYSSIFTKNGREAIDFFIAEIKANRKVTAMILDLTVPGEMGGTEAIAEIRRMDQKIPVFVASGYANDPVMAHPREYGFTASICKPFRIVDLAEMLNEHIEGKKDE